MYGDTDTDLTYCAFPPVSTGPSYVRVPITPQKFLTKVPDNRQAISRQTKRRTTTSLSHISSAIQPPLLHGSCIGTVAINIYAMSKIRWQELSNERYVGHNWYRVHFPQCVVRDLLNPPPPPLRITPALAATSCGNVVRSADVMIFST